MGQRLFADRYGDAVGLVGNLGECVDDVGVVPAVLPHRQQKKTVADFCQGLFVHELLPFLCWDGSSITGNPRRLLKRLIFSRTICMVFDSGRYLHRKIFLYTGSINC